jgi:malate dehydrogenase (oxaloacetate-decarboxylating)
VTSIQTESLQKHEEWQGKLDIISKVPLKNTHDLSLAYTPGVAEPCRAIHANKNEVYRYTMKGNTIAIVTDGTAVLGLGDIGPEAALPVMEGKAILFREFGGVNAIPICLATKNVDEIVNTIKLIAPGIGGVNLEDIAAPRCFEIEERLKKELDIPVFHDDQHGTAIVVLAALINALRLVEKQKSNVRVVVCGAGSAGIAIAKLLLRDGFENLVLVDKNGILNIDADWMNWAQREMAEQTNRENLFGGLKEACANADVFIGVSGPNVLTEEMVASMNQNAIVLAMANPDPEILPQLAQKAGARVVGTGRSDFANQVNNVLAFPGIFRGVLEARARAITEEMKVAAAYAIAELVLPTELTEDYIIPAALDRRVGPHVAAAIVQEFRRSNEKS